MSYKNVSLLSCDGSDSVSLTCDSAMTERLKRMSNDSPPKLRPQWVKRSWQVAIKAGGKRANGRQTSATEQSRESDRGAKWLQIARSKWLFNASCLRLSPLKSEDCVIVQQREESSDDEEISSVTDGATGDWCRMFSESLFLFLTIVQTHLSTSVPNLINYLFINCMN